jgi:hypothetical protein
MFTVLCIYFTARLSSWIMAHSELSFCVNFHITAASNSSSSYVYKTHSAKLWPIYEEILNEYIYIYIFDHSICSVLKLKYLKRNGKDERKNITNSLHMLSLFQPKYWQHPISGTIERDSYIQYTDRKNINLLSPLVWIWAHTRRWSRKHAPPPPTHTRPHTHTCTYSIIHTYCIYTSSF